MMEFNTLSLWSARTVKKLMLWEGTDNLTLDTVEEVAAHLLLLEEHL